MPEAPVTEREGFTGELWRSIEGIYTEILAHPFLRRNALPTYKEMGFDATLAMQADVALLLLRALFAQGTPQTELLFAALLRGLGKSESAIYALVEELAPRFDRDTDEVFESIWAPAAAEDGGTPQANAPMQLHKGGWRAV